jgi:RimJ/RimL family protein N-acetyltransferase
MRWTFTDPVRTERLRLRPVVARDAEAVLAYRSLAQVSRYVPFEPMDADDVAQRIAGRWAQTTLDEDHTSLLLGIALADGDRVIGDLTLMMGPPEHRGAELGWVLDPTRSGHGYATEAAHALLHLCFDTLGLHRVTARIDARNEPSLRLADRLGMRREAHLIENEWFKGGWSDEFDFALLEHEWVAQHARGAGGGGCRWPLQSEAGSGQGEGAGTLGGWPA